MKTKAKNIKYPVCPECGCNTIVLFTPPKEGIVGTEKGYETIGTPEYVDWEQAHIYCCNAETNCKIQTKLFDLFTPQDEPRHSLISSECERAAIEAVETERKFFLNVLDGVDIANKELGEGSGTRAIRFALQSRSPKSSALTHTKL